MVASADNHTFAIGLDRVRYIGPVNIKVPANKEFGGLSPPSSSSSCLFVDCVQKPIVLFSMPLEGFCFRGFLSLSSILRPAGCSNFKGFSPRGTCWR